MSLSQFQNALALLIRLPERNRGEELESFLDKFTLTATERNRLNALSEDPNVVKYGRSMANVRWEGLERRLSLVTSFLNPSLLEQIWRLHFEPTATQLNGPRFGEAFYDFLLADSEVQAILEREAPSFINDVIKFERAHVAFRSGSLVNPPSPASESCLKHQKFCFLKLDHDIPELVARLREDDPADAGGYAPVARPVHLLLLGEPFRGSCRYFEVTEDIETFLARAQTATAIERPSFYEDLIKIGICKVSIQGEHHESHTTRTVSL